MTKENKAPHEELHKSHRAPWLRAGILGLNDGVVSTSSLMLGVLAASLNDKAILTAGIAGLVAGALSMAAGEYVSVSSQKDAEKADIAIEKRSLAKDPEGELHELAKIYEERGLDAKLAHKVAQALHDHDALGAHARDELGIDSEDLANPLQAAVTSASSFAVGAAVPILAAVLVSSSKSGVWAITLSSLVALAISGAAGAFLGGGHRTVAALRVLAGGGAAMALTYLIGHFIGVSV